MELYKKHISDLGRIVTGKTPRTSIPENYGGEIPFLTPSDDLSGKYAPKTNKTITQLGLNEVKNCLLPSKTVCVSCIGSDLGKAVITDEPTVTNQQFNSIIPNEENDADFIYYLMSAVGKRLNFFSKTSTAVPIINKSTFSGYEIDVPSISNQRKIAKILSSLDDKIEVNKRINENLEQQAQALFKSWFVDFEPFKDGEFVESELGMIPKGWRVVTLNEACKKITDGSHYSPKDNANGTIPMLSVKDMNHNGFDYSSCKMIDIDEFKRMKANDCVPLKNDILVAKDGSYLKEIFICSEEIQQAILSSIAIFRSNNEVIYPDILLQLLRTPNVRKDVGDNYVSGSALPRIVLKDFKKYKFIVAPIEVQNRVYEALNSINRSINYNERESRRLATLRDTLLPKLMSGELKVNDINV